MPFPILTLLAALALAVPTAAAEPRVANDGRTAPLFDDLGDHHHAITTQSATAQRYFDQGLVLAYGFNHAEAVRSFREAQRLDPSCAMCFWGEAYALGPNINKPMDDADVPAAYAAARRALALSDNATPAERRYIEAVVHRYAPAPVADRTPLDAAYAAVMSAVTREFPEDDDAAALYAEALMNTMPWDYYDADGSPKAATVTVTNTLERVLERSPDHPGAIHFYIHTVEASRSPERAEAPADRLATLVPGSGHLVHMPSHIYLRVGRYHDATLVNERAAAADESYINQCRAQGFYPALYYPHNVHFLWYTASLEGRSEMALRTARKLAENVPVDLIDGIPLIEQFLAVPMWSKVQFARWDDVLAEPKPRAGHAFATSMWHATRGVALASLGRVGEARAARTALVEASRPFGPDAYETFGYPADRLVAIATAVLDAALAAARGRPAARIASLEAAVAIEDALPYMEPPYWFFPVRPLLGNALLDAGRPAEAEAVYRADLAKVPDNGWSLHGLADSLDRQGAHEAAVAARAAAAEAWARADVEP